MLPLSVISQYIYIHICFGLFISHLKNDCAKAPISEIPLGKLLVMPVTLRLVILNEDNFETVLNMDDFLLNRTIDIFFVYNKCFNGHNLFCRHSVCCR